MANQALKDTLILPETNFPMRGDLVKREPKRLEHWEALSLYQRTQEKNRSGSPYILHDGPPFTNGDVHIGTALNKTLKDIILRYKNLKGHRAPYVPGWDCHGLPIEHKVSRQNQAEGRALEPAELRKACAKFSAEYIEKQRKQFQRLGVLADWEREYKTMKPTYEADILRTFACFVEKGLVYRSKKPIYWSIPCETALAEAEIEYKDHKSPAIHVAFPLPAADASKAGLPEDTFVVIWTTTPWTLPANLAIAVHPRLDYVPVTHEGKTYVVVRELAQNFIEKCGLEGATLGDPIKGEQLEGLKPRHPFIDRESPIVLADYVTTEQGTGCVHTAPGHGLEDYLTGLKYGLEIYCPLDDEGKYLDDGQIPPELIGVSVLETDKGCPANIEVLKLLKANSALLHKENYAHSYPHCWRSKTPVVFRAMDQWFVALDKDDMRQKALDEIGNCKWVPNWGENRIRAAVENRPDWCISRQRSWGVPLPAFYDAESGEALLDAGVIRALADKIAEYGTDLWFEQDAATLLEGIPLPEGFSADRLKKGTDTLDVWIDSGCSHRAVLQHHDDLTSPADLYLEGSDQHRGWFQSSLWTGVVADGHAPYKTVLTHGFIVKEDKTKISKSDTGKPQTADAYVNQYGADVIRLWISSEDYRNDIPLSDGILKQVANTYRTLRNTLRFQLGTLSDFDAATDMVEVDKMTSIDRWALHQTADLINAVTDAYENYEFHRVYQLINRYCTVTLSAIWHDILKDRLYTYGRTWHERRSAQSAIYHSFRTLVRLVAPITTFTADEAWSFFHGEEYSEKSIHLEDWPEANANWLNPELAKEFEQLLGFRDKVNEQLEALRKAKSIGQALEARITIKGAPDTAAMSLLEKYREELAELFIVSHVHFETSEDEPTPHAEPAGGTRCPRCWRADQTLEEADGFEEHVCPRCKAALMNEPAPC